MRNSPLSAKNPIDVTTLAHEARLTFHLWLPPHIYCTAYSVATKPGSLPSLGMAYSAVA